MGGFWAPCVTYTVYAQKSSWPYDSKKEGRGLTNDDGHEALCGKGFLGVSINEYTPCVCAYTHKGKNIFLFL